MGKLGKDLEKICLLPQRKCNDYDSWGVCQANLISMVERDAALEELKVYGRDPTNAEPIYTKEVCMTNTPTGVLGVLGVLTQV